MTSSEMVKAPPADHGIISKESQSTESQEQQEAVANDTASSPARADSPISVASTSSTASTPKKKKKKKNRRANKQQTTQSPSHTNTRLAPTTSTTPDDNNNNNNMTSLPLLICSLGNPGAAYTNTLHSAGHNAILALSTLLQTSQFTKDRSYANGLLTRSDSPETPWTLWQSPSYMNDSGKGVVAAYRTWLREYPQGRLVVIHDELEKPLGSVTVRDKDGLSARGHNGIKSCLASLGGVRFVRVGVGIGRPLSRAPDDVARYVLKKMTAVERQKVEGSAGEIVDKLLAVRA